MSWSVGARLTAAIVGGCTITNVAFAAAVWDPWTRLIGVISLLGVIGLITSWNESSVWRSASPGALVVAVVSAVGMALGAWAMMVLAPMRMQMTFLSQLTGGHSAGVIAVTLPLAVLGEELFWRATVARFAVARFGPVTGVLVACAAYGLAHVASGTFLLPLAAFGAGLVWAALFVTLGNLATPIVSHFLLDALVLFAVIG